MISILVVLVVIGVVLYLVNTLLPMDPKIRTIINVVVVLGVCLWLLNVFGILGGDAFAGRHVNSEPSFHRHLEPCGSFGYAAHLLAKLLH